jgi:site-specific DNA-methyltransferase (adenine-specific)
MNDYEQLIEMMFADGTLDQSVRQEIEGMNDLQKRLNIVRILDKGLGLFTKIEGIMNLGKMDYIKEVIKLLKDYVLIADVKQKEAGEVMTPLWFVKEMLSVLPEDSWSNPELKWLDPANGTGPYPILVIYKLMVGLKDWEPDDEKRYKYIIENMIYVSELQPKNMFLYMNAVNPMSEYNLNIYTGSFLEREFDSYMKSVWSINKVDITIGNPPYQEMDGGAKASAKPIYNLFTEKGILISDKVLFVTPSRWFAGGKGLDTFRRMMMSSNKIKIINHFSDASLIFGKSVDITGGVSYFLYDKNYDGDCLLNDSIIDMRKYDIILNPKNYSIIDKVSTIESISTICMGRGDNTFGIQTNDIRIKSERLDDNHIRCFVSKNKGFEKWIDINDVKNHINLNTYKVITAESNGEYPRFGNKFIGLSTDVCSGSYIWFSVNSLTEAESLISYLNCKIPNYLLSLRKISQHIKPDTCRWIPLLPLDRIWDDKKISDYLNLSEEEQNLIIK